MKPTIEEQRTAEILRLYAVQDGLVQAYASLWHQHYTLQAHHSLKGDTTRLLSERRLVWPIHLIWKGWPFKINKKGIHRDRYYKWYSRHGSCEWYGVIQYIRVGPVIFELGRDEAMGYARTRPIENFDRMVKDAHACAEGTTQQLLQRLNRSAGQP